ncbi:MAG: hypothetical protein IPM26_12940 [Saprospiraceae bacterium]|nr:hypothetical protein [Saprospiraceae bacterium]
MTGIGNLLIGISGLLFMIALHLLYGNHTKSGDAGVGYAWSLLLTLSGQVICLTIVALITAKKGGFSWIVGAGSGRTLFIIAGFLLAIWGIAFFSMGEGTGHLPVFIRSLLKILPPVLYLSVLAASVLLLNIPLRQSLPDWVWRLPVYFPVIVGLLAFMIVFTKKMQRDAENFKSYQSGKAQQFQSELDQIDATDLERDMVFLLSYTDKNQSSVLRKRALQRIHTREDWQEELVRRLQNDWAPEVFTFLASKDVPDEGMFAEALKVGILIQARLIRESIRNCNSAYDLYPGRFSWEVERVLSTLDRFKDTGINYTSQVNELRKSLDEPVHFNKPELKAKILLDRWLKKHHTL